MHVLGRTPGYGSPVTPPVQERFLLRRAPELCLRLLIALPTGVGIPRNRIYSLSRDRKGALGRSLVAYLARKLSDYLVKDAAGYFHREPAMISQSMMKMENLLRTDEDRAHKVGMIERELTRNRRKILY